MEEGSGLWDCDGCWFASLRACGRNACIRKSGGGGLRKNFLSLSLRPPPLFATIGIACFNIANIMQLEVFLKQVVFKAKGREGFSAPPYLRF